VLEVNKFYQGGSGRLFLLAQGNTAN